ncbi:MAG: hypothetical protein ABI972_03455 [Acidobacteriota bacterium]
MRSGYVCLLAAMLWQAAAQEPLVIPVASAGAAAIQFELQASGAAQMPDGILYQGDASLVTPQGKITFAKSELWFGYAPGTQQVQTVRGKAYVPTPLSEEAVSIDEPVMAEVGYDLGANLKDLGVPLIDDRGYIFFKFDAGLTMHFGTPPPDNLEDEPDTSFEISFPAGAAARILIDPLDPMFYFAGAITTPNSKKKKDGEAEGSQPSEGTGKQDGEDSDDMNGVLIGSGNSYQAMFPFRPLVTWGIEDKAREFYGHRIQTGTFPLFELPVEVTGHVVTNLDPLATGELAIDPMGIGFGPVVQAGANGRFAFSLDFLKVSGLGDLMNLTVPLGKATAAVEIVNDRQLAYISGIYDPASDLGMGLLLSHDQELKVAALASSDVSESRLYMEGSYKVGASEFGKMVGFDVGNILRVDGRLRIDKAGLFLHALTETGANMGPLTSRGQVAAEMEIPAADPANRYMQLSGLIDFAGLGMDGVGKVSPFGLAVTGNLTAPKFSMAITGGVQKLSGTPTVFGNMSVPAALQPDLEGEITKESQKAQQEIDNALSSYQKATKDYEFELSLRGMRTAVPPVVDAIVSEIDQQIPKQLNAKWPKTKTLFGSVEAPGKSAALKYANAQAEPHKARLRELKRQMQSADNASVRRALESAIQNLLNNPRLRITYKVPVVNKTITIYDRVIVDSSMAAKLNAAAAGVRALPEASNVKVSAEQVWNNVPQREILRETAGAIEKGAAAAIPHIQTIGFRFPLGQPEWIYQVVVTQFGKQSTLEIRVAPANIGSIGAIVGQALANTL